MNKALRYTLIIVAAIVALVIAAAAIIAFTFDPNAYKAKIQELVKEKTGRTLTLAGDIDLTFFPSLGVRLGEASLSERKSAETFASVENARISMELLPLLRQELVVDAIKIEGLRANAVRDKNGSFNFDDLLPKEEKQEEQAAPMRFDIDGVELTNSALSYRDLATGAHYQITNLNVDTGGIALGRETPIKLAFHLNANQPKVDLDAKLDTRLAFHFNPQRVQFQNLEVSVKGSAAEFQKLDLSLKGSGEAHPATQELSLAKLNLALAGVRAGENVDVKLEIPQLKLTQKAVAGENVVLDAKLAGKEGSTSAHLTVPKITGDANSFQLGPLALNANVKRGEDAITAKLTAPLSGRFEQGSMTPAALSSSEAAVELGGKMGGNTFQASLASPLTVNVPQQQIELPKLGLRASLSGKDLPAKEIAAQLAGSATANLKKEQAQLNISGTVDQSKLQGRFGVTGFAKPAISFEAEMDQLNLNRYMAADAKKPQAEKQTKPVQGEPEKPFDLSALKDLNANGTLKIGSLTAADLKASQVTLTLKAANGKVQLDPLAANLYQGRMTGAASVNAASTPMFTLKQNLNGIAVGPLLKDIAEKDLLEGKGNVSLDVAAQGATLSAIKQTLNGTAALKLEDGALNGINIAQSIRSAKAQVAALRGEAAPTSTGPQKTDFSELSASFAIKNGIAHNDDLSIKSPLLRIGGSGDVNIPAEKLDYLMKATVVATSKGQGGAELEALKGLTVPVKVFGPLNAPEYKVDLSGLATQAAQQKLEEKKEELKARAQEKIQERLFGKQGQDAQKKEGSEQRLQDALKGIFK